jgi:SAGA-associated factor 29
MPHHATTGVSIREDAPPSELAVAVARHFESLQVPEEEAIYGFLERLDEKGATATTTLTAATTGATRAARKTLETDYGRQSASFLTTLRPPAQRKRRRTKASARPSEQVAAKVTRTDENGSWILASVQRFYPETETYDVQDEDDTTKLIRLPWSHVMRLSTGTEGVFSKNNECMAIFPETTSFYRALVSKAPVWVWDTARRQPVVQELVVKFEDDEDAAGRTPHRRVPARYVIPIPTEYFCDEADDVDLTPPK